MFDIAVLYVDEYVVFSIFGRYVESTFPFV